MLTPIPSAMSGSNPIVTNSVVPIANAPAARATRANPTVPERPEPARLTRRSSHRRTNPILARWATIRHSQAVWPDVTIDDTVLRPPGRGPAGVGVPMSTTEGFEAFVAARSGRLLRTAYLLTHDHGLAEDLVQTALAKAWFVWSRIDGDPEPYVRKVVVNTYASWWRRRWNREHPTGDIPETSTDTGTHDRTDLWRALERLPRRQRAVVVLRYFEDLTEAETARVLDCTVGT